MNIQTVFRNSLIAAGAFYLSYWVAPPLEWGYSKLVHLRFVGYFETAVLMPLLMNLPDALVAVGVGASVAWLVDSKRPAAWVAIPAALYVYFDYVGYSWVQPPTISQRLGQVVGALFLAFACFVGAMTVIGHRRAESAPVR